jgi:UDP-3-O-[3-hydroxymyristoyl] glucosamine N-acyltransferase
MRVRALAEWLGLPFEGDGEKELTRAAPLEDAGAAGLAFVDSRKAAQQAQASAAGCLIVPLDFPNPGGGRTLIRAAEPRGAFARSITRLHPPPPAEAGIHPTAVVARTAELGPEVAVGPYAVVGDSTRVGARTRIGAGCVVGSRVNLGQDCVLHAQATIYDDCDIGARTILHSGSVIGADGFGYVMTGGRYEKFPQIGRVAIGEDCEIGANACVDRAALGVTTIGEGTKLDNMVHIAHNCRIGKHVVIAAQTGIAGGSVVEDYVVIGGQVGIADKVRIETRAVLGSACKIPTSKIIRSGDVVWGMPARPLKDYLEQLANLGRLPEVRKELADLRRRLEELEARGDAAIRPNSSGRE